MWNHSQRLSLFSRSSSGSVASVAGVGLAGVLSHRRRRGTITAMVTSLIVVRLIAEVQACASRLRNTMTMQRPTFFVQKWSLFGSCGVDITVVVRCPHKHLLVAHDIVNSLMSHCINPTQGRCRRGGAKGAYKGGSRRKCTQVWASCLGCSMSCGVMLTSHPRGVSPLGILHLQLPCALLLVPSTWL